MKALRFYFTCISMLAILFGVQSCQHELLEPDDQTSKTCEMIFTACYELNTKTIRQEDKSVWWSPKEEINVFYGEKSTSKFVSLNDEPSPVAQFKGSLDTFTGTNESGAESEFFYAVYPYSFDNKYSDGALSLTLPHQQSAVANTFDTGTWQGVLNGGETTKVTTERKEAAHSKYVWTGNGEDNLWTNPLNWECSNNSCYGYPGVKGINYYSWVEFVSSPSSPIDLGGGVYDFIDNGAFVVGDGVAVEFYNGTLRVHGSKPMNKGDDYKIGRSNSTMTFNEVNIDNLDILQNQNQAVPLNIR